MPDDVVEITREEHAALLEGQLAGQVIAADADGYPELVEPPPPSPEQLATGERAWRDSELLASDRMIARHRDERDMGGAVTLTAEQFAELLAYRQALRDWPEARAFPDTAARPAPPDWLTR